MRKEYFVLGLASLAVVLAVTLSFGGNSANDKFSLQGMVCIYKNGQLIECKHNLITNAGKDHIKECIGAGSTTSGCRMGYLALANCTNGVSASDTSLCNGQEWTTCGLARADATYNSIGTGNWSHTYQWTSSCDNAIVNATGLFNASSGGTLFAETTFTSVTLMNGDKLNVTYYTWVQ